LDKRNEIGRRLHPDRGIKNRNPQSKLSNMEIHTYLPEKVIQSFIPEVNRVVYHKSLEDTISEGINSAVLINWNDYFDDYELIIPIVDGGKVLKFRAPTLYYHNKLGGDIRAIKKYSKHTVRQTY